MNRRRGRSSCLQFIRRYCGTHQRFKRFFLVLLFVLVTGIVYHTQRGRQTLSGSSRSQSEKPEPQTFSTESVTASPKFSNGCRVSPVDFSELDKLLLQSSPKECSGNLPWFEVVDGNKLRLRNQTHLRVGNVTCSFADFYYVSDSKTRNSTPVWSTSGEYTLNNSDVVKVHCNGDSGLQYESTELGVAPSKRTDIGWEFTPKENMGLSILILLYDGISRRLFEKKLPKTDAFLRDMGSITLRGYSAFQPNTIGALLPLLTGESFNELPTTSKKQVDAVSVSTYPFIFREATSRGYLTAYVEDTWDIHTFRFPGLTGFDFPPTDHFIQHYIKVMEDNNVTVVGCREGKVYHLDYLEYFMNLMDTYKLVPKFFLGLHSRLSYDDINLVGEHDDEIVEFLEQLKFKGHMNDTMIMLMGNQGPPHSRFGNTKGGKLEETHPFIRIIMPNWFSKKNPGEYRNLVDNAESGVLLTPYDLHATFLAILDDGLLEDRLQVWLAKGLDAADTRARSLFSKIPKRECKDVVIPAQSCDCIDWLPIPTENLLIREIVGQVMAAINKFTEVAKGRCARLLVDTISSAEGAVLNNNKETYLVSFSVVPSGGAFEAVTTWNEYSRKIDVDVTEIRLTNRYNNYSQCIQGTFPELISFCLCTTT